MPDNSAQVMERTEVTLPEPLMEHYRKLARAANQPVEVVIENQLDKTKEYQAQRPLYFPDSERNELERLTGGRVLKDAPAAIRAVQSIMSFIVNVPGEAPVEVTLGPTLAHRLMTRNFGKTTEEHIIKEVIEGLERFVGMR